MTPIKVFLGYDSVESAAYHTCVQSIINHTDYPVEIIPIKRSMLPFFKRERDNTQSNEFTYSRFLVPYLCDYKGWAIFIDGADMMLRTSLKELWDLRDDTKAVQCVQHDYTPKDSEKFLGAKQYAYPRKNWSSVMLFNNAMCRNLTLNYVEKADPADLHRMKWAYDEHIGALPVEWNHLVGEYPPNPDAKLVHWTIGGPWFDDYIDTEFSGEWFTMFKDMVHTTQMQEILMSRENVLG